MRIRTPSAFGAAPRLLSALVLSAALFFQAAPVLAQGLLDDVNDTSSKHYLLTLAGTAGPERFTGVKALLRLSNSPPGRPNPYELEIVGLPRDNTKFTFFWKSGDNPMEVVSSSIRSTYDQTRTQSREIHFFYWDTRFHKPKGILTQQDKEDFERTKKVSPPIRIPVAKGELKVNVLGGIVNGEVVLTGYDPESRQHIRYQARFEGQATTTARTKTPVGKFD